MVHQHICARFIDQHICAILIFLTDFQGQLDSTVLFSLFSVVQVERMVLYIKRCFPLKLDLNLPDQSQFHKTPTACPRHLQPALPTYSLPATPTACPPHLQPARHTYRFPATPTACPPHLQVPRDREWLLHRH